MGVSDDLSHGVLRDLMPGRPIRFYPAMLSSEADALAWARAGAPEGAVVAAGYQISPRGRAGTMWEMDPSSSVLFSLILRPPWKPEHEGRLYTVAACALADVASDESTVQWPDEVFVDDRRAGAVGTQVGLDEDGITWAVVNVLLEDRPAPHGDVVARTVEAIDRRYRSSLDDLLDDYTARCRTLGARVRARLIPLGPAGPEIAGTAVAVLGDGALSIETEKGNRVAVRPQNLGVLERTH